MNRSISWVFASALIAAVEVTTYSAPAEAQVILYPPPAYVASYSPYYYNGYGHYFYRNNWYYHDGGGWHGYGHTPAALSGYRGWGGHRYGGWGGGGRGGGGHGGGGHGGGHGGR